MEICFGLYFPSCYLGLWCLFIVFSEEASTAVFILQTGLGIGILAGNRIFTSEDLNEDFNEGTIANLWAEL